MRPGRSSNPFGAEIDYSELAAALAAQIGTSQSLTWAAAGSDTVKERISYPFDGAEVKSIHVAPIGTAATTGTLGINQGIDDAGNDVLSAATFDLTTLTADTLAAMTLTSTDADKQGDDTDGITLSMVNSDAAHIVTVFFGPQ